MRKGKHGLAFELVPASNPLTFMEVDSLLKKL